RGCYRQNSGTTLEVTLRPGSGPALTVARPITLAQGSALVISLENVRVGETVPVLAGPVLCGKFSRITVAGGKHRVVPRYSSAGLSVRVLAAE
ncbi:MAG: phosphoesterase, partial [Umezawaea sp.]